MSASLDSLCARTTSELGKTQGLRVGISPAGILQRVHELYRVHERACGGRKHADGCTQQVLTSLKKRLFYFPWEQMAAAGEPTYTFRSYSQYLRQWLSVTRGSGRATHTAVKQSTSKFFCAQLDLHAFSPNDSKMVVPAELVHYLARLEPQSFDNLSDAEESAQHNNPQCIV